MNRPRLICLLLALVTLLLYLPVGWHDFIVYDDGDYVTQNKVVQAGLTWNGVKWAFDSWHSSNWHPLTWLSHMLDCQLFGLNPGAHHLINVTFHAANTVLLFLLLLRLTQAFWPAAIIAALFAWHPLHVESVAWIAERKDVLSTFFGLLALLAYVRYAQRQSRVERRESSAKKPSSALDPRPSTLDYSLALLFFACSLMSKPMLVTLPFVMLLLDFWPLERVSSWRPIILEKIPFFLLTIASCVVTYFAQRARSVISLEQFPLDLRIGNAVLSYGRYLWKMIWPVDLAIIYPLSAELAWAWVAVTVVILAGISTCVWLARRKSPYLLVGWFWFLGTLIPVIGLVQVGRASMADRYSYVPLIGIFIAVVYGIQNLAARFRIKPMSLGLLASLTLAGCLIGTERQLSFWENDETLFGHAVDVTKNNSTAHINFGIALEKLGREDEAQVHYQEALRADPNSVEAHDDIGIYLDKMGKTDEALFHYREALKLWPESPVAHMNLGALFAKLGQFDEAMQHYQAAAQFDPTDARPHYLMGKARLRQGRSADAVAAFHNALRLYPDDTETLLWLARVLAADENAEVRNGVEAVTSAERANALMGSGNPVALDVLAMAYAEAGRFDEAIRADEAAMKFVQTLQITDAINSIAEHLQLFRNGKAYHTSFAQPEKM